MPDIATLVPDIERLFQEGVHLDATLLETFSREIGTNLQERFQEYARERQPYLRLSNVGRPLRQLWFELKSGLKPEPLQANAKLKFLYGDLIEDLIILLAAVAGHKVTDFQRKVEVDGVKGTIDVRIDDVLVDIKSASSFSFAKFRDGSLRENDPFGYIAQLAGYSCALGGVDGAFLVVDKTLGHLHLERFSAGELSEYKVRERIAQAREVLAQSTPPEILCYEPIPEGKSGNLKLPIGCSYCAYKHHCHPGLRTFLYSNGPVYLTHVEVQPRVFEVQQQNAARGEAT